MPLTLKNVLLLHLEKQTLEQSKAMNAWQDTGAVFATETGAYTHPETFHRSVTNLIQWSDPKTLTETKLLGVPVENRKKLEAIISSGEGLPDISPHDLRHTAATLMLKRGTPVEVVSKILGHALVSITLDIYRQVSEDEKRQRMPDLFDSPLPD